jgi:hypothetical protein
MDEDLSSGAQGIDCGCEECGEESGGTAQILRTKRTLMERLKMEHKRLTDQIARSRDRLDFTNAAIVLLNNHPEYEPVFDLFERGL